MSEALSPGPSVESSSSTLPAPLMRARRAVGQKERFTAMMVCAQAMEVAAMQASVAPRTLMLR